MSSGEVPSAAVVSEGPGSSASRFRWRGTGISRLEGFSDAAFAFAVTLLVVSLEVPDSYGDLVATLRGFPAFAVCFAYLLGIWFHHYHFFRRYGLEDGPTIALNGLLLFVVLFFVYPLKFLFLFLSEIFLAAGGPQGAMIARDPELDAVSLMTIFGAGFAAVFTIFILLYLHAWRRREPLGLNAYERYDTWTSVQHFAIYVAIALVSIAMARIGGSRMAFWSGIVYAFLGPATMIHGSWRQHRRESHLATAGTGSEP